MGRSFLKNWYLPLALFVVLTVGLGAGPVWGEPITRGEGNQSVMLQPLTDSELAEVAGKNAWVPLPVLLREPLQSARARTLQTLSNVSKQAASVLRQQGRIILDSDIVVRGWDRISKQVSDTLGRIKVRFPAR
jgi:hypothetical protein